MSGKKEKSNKFLEEIVGWRKVEHVMFVEWWLFLSDGSCVEDSEQCQNESQETRLKKNPTISTITDQRKKPKVIILYIYILYKELKQTFCHITQ